MILVEKLSRVMGEGGDYGSKVVAEYLVEIELSIELLLVVLSWESWVWILIV